MRLPSLFFLALPLLAAMSCQAPPLKTGEEVAKNILLRVDYDNTSLTTPILDIWGGAGDPFGTTKTSRWVGAAIRAQVMADGGVRFAIVLPYQSDVPLAVGPAKDADGTEYQVVPRYRAELFFTPTVTLRNGVWAIDVTRSYLDDRINTGLLFEVEGIPVLVEIPPAYVAGMLLALDEHNAKTDPDAGSGEPMPDGSAGTSSGSPARD